MNHLFKMDWYHVLLILIPSLLFPNCILTLECGEYTSPNNILETRIVNGELAAVGEFPWQVSIQRKVRVKLENTNANANTTGTGAATGATVDTDSKEDSDPSNSLNELDSLLDEEQLLQASSLWHELLREKNLTEEEVLQWPHHFPTREPPKISMPPTMSTMFPPMSSIPTFPTSRPSNTTFSSRFPPLPTFPPNHSFPPISVNLPPKPSPPPVTLPKQWTQWPTSRPWTSHKPSFPPIPTISRMPTWSTPSSPKMPPIILPIPTLPPRPRPPLPQPPATSPRPHPIPSRPPEVSYNWRWQHFCGGSIINHHWIMTAAHCVESMKNTYSPGMIQIMAGSTNWRVPDSPYAQIVPVDRIIVHEGWRQHTGQNDIALLHLARPLSYIKQDKIYVNSVCLSRDSVPNYQGIASSSGWGFLTKDNRITPELLRRVDLPMVDHVNCRNAFSRVIEITTNQVCAGRSPKGNCMGDSGGPLILKQGNQAVQVGIVSFSIPCAVPGYPDVFTRVSRFLDWISMMTGLTFQP